MQMLEAAKSVTNKQINPNQSVLTLLIVVPRVWSLECSKTNQEGYFDASFSAFVGTISLDMCCACLHGTVQPYSEQCP